jgi:hypothetical protein
VTPAGLKELRRLHGEADGALQALDDYLESLERSR